jgi:hypothetical protein
VLGQSFLEERFARRFIWLLAAAADEAGQVRIIQVPSPALPVFTTLVDPVEKVSKARIFFIPAEFSPNRPINVISARKYTSPRKRNCFHWASEAGS